ncbi:S9 family peptidase [Chitinophaga sp. sic0106]|uniref:alpha/beta hydrolase family protein n=1 Tax=Chitinophaga sp. sic0106 TaxID=2854785 RepID=UPI001C495BAB|nr:CocE/NonD family hydrolase [Chitinophaga sp. sic0106]MBV7529306.1 CocE/NonD family hydrolase [Chitinophaga sp. sic0106]
MQRLLLVWMMVLVIAQSATAQEADKIMGNWYGVVSANNEKLRTTINLTTYGGKLTGSIGFPDRVTEFKAFDSVSLNAGLLFLRLREIDLVFIGKVSPRKDSISGKFIWGNINQDVTLTHKVINTAELVYPRPQEPKPPFAYRTEEVSFQNDADSVRLAGTFVRPANFANNFPVVVMIPGAGAKNRDNETARHKMFLVMADYFAQNGIASLRFDKRGVGGSGGNTDTTDIFGTARDAAAAVRYLKTRIDIDPHSIGVLGFGEGALSAQILAANNPAMAFVVSMAGMGVTGSELSAQQQIIAARAAGLSDKEIAEDAALMKPYRDALMTGKTVAETNAAGTRALEAIYDQLPAAVKQSVDKQQFAAEGVVSPEMLSILHYKPVTYLREIRCPFMAVNGANDQQVLAEPNLNALERGLTENGNIMVTVRKFAGLNHLFQSCNTCTDKEYITLEQTIDPLVPEFIAHWILQLPPVGR